jgi:hypothetical protein
VLLAALALAATAWCVWHGGGPAPETEAEARASREAEAHAGPAAQASAGAPGADVGRGAEPLREASAAAGPEPRPPWVVQLLSRETRAPIPGVMLYLDHYRIADLTKEQRAELDENVRQNRVEKNLETFAPRARTDAQGSATFPRVKAGATCWALAGWYGSRFLAETEPNPCVMLADLDTVLTLQAVDGRGVPIPGPLGFRLQFLDGDRLLGKLGAYAGAGSAEARVGHFATRLCEAVDGRTEWTKTVVAVEASLFPEVELELPAFSGKDQVVRVALPASGSVRVRVSGLPGASLATTRVSLCPLNESGGRGTDSPIVDGAASFGTVGLGLRLEASLEPPPLGRQVRPLVFAGPRKEGELVEAEMRL